MEEYIIYYWPLAGRAEYLRIILEEKGVKYKQINDRDQIVSKVLQNGIGGFPVLFPPVLCKGDFHLGQAPVASRFLAKEFDLLPEAEEDQWLAENVHTTIHDFVAEGRLAFHGIHPTGPYLEQKEGTQRYIDNFVDNRIHRWLKYFEAVLKRNNGGQGFLFGNKLTYVDLALATSLRACEASYGPAYQAADYCPLIKAHRARIEARPNIAAYFKSDRFIPFSDNSMM
ncbi:hypothetical protein FSP39_020566 [Pinctada imbricata]|uniref:Glutathione S-transferase n=1 Tax=Pinctada imbricata TaxID=66713 RepID=A0AA89CB38_PINIB|nr:hypothetical protein FSP39_020566 [Pinctada imbricata]